MAECERLITASKLRELYGGISTMTLWRWEKAGIIEPDAVIRGRKYYGARNHPRALGDQQIARPTSPIAQEPEAEGDDK